jgi:hypothetical protein
VTKALWRPSRRNFIAASAALAASFGARAALPADIKPAKPYPLLSHDLKLQLEAIQPSIGSHHIKFYPCLATLIDGRKLDGVCLIDAETFERELSNSGRAVVSLDRVKSIANSPSRLPPKLAGKIYRSGEAGMGYFIFTLVFDDGSRLPCRTTDVVDFVEIPHSFEGRKIVNVVPHAGRQEILAGKTQGHDAAHFWCPYRTA